MNLLDLLFPKRCKGCGKYGSYLCEKCASTLIQLPLICPHCKKLAIGGITHPVCKRSFGLDGLWSLGAYQDPLRSLIQTLKYRFVEEISHLVSDQIVMYWARNQPYFLNEIIQEKGEGWLISAVPLHKKRERWRGFNQSEQICIDLSKRLGLHYVDLLIRIKETKSQAKLAAYQRRENIKRAFILRDRNEVRGKKVLLFDDVWTTGETMKECGYVLKRAGAKKVWAITIAR